MKTTFPLLFASVMLLSNCSKDEFQYHFESAPKLLVAIRENGHLITEYRYDTYNRLIQANRYNKGDTIYLSEYFEYNSQNQLIRKIYGEYIETYQYYSCGRLRTTFLNFRSAIDGYNWEQKTEFQFRSGRISKGIKSFTNGNEISYYSYKYDSKGNTIERTEYGISPDYPDLMLTQLKFTYDDKINPGTSTRSGIWGESLADITQGNNPTYSYYYNIIMSSFPPQFEITYDYEQTGLPIKEYRKQLQHLQGTTVFDYEYIDKIK